ncbi:DNA polymerase III, epsilon subunit [Denitrovibrio acetiphilus DSM 12809]|uniref:DNA polymerase III, epsilon subunit n=1 Tax=Denitrovibrio acetiphilus (strain DSM 12809 / NBRC 114555 / N2460) TaxID=522772 RepID=D4H0K8_DENA2|nr:3'-5' exonuclease [Denitrovibrio acetiphilus]ADD68521.1 DNA polymerase III, epsilon subunit [Denitrovibrio acetiphilus DSM 12809]
MISKLFSKKQNTGVPKDPVAIFVNKKCENINNNKTLNTDIQNAVFSVIDTETTGLDLNDARIINVAAVKVQNFKIIDFYNSFINPETEIPKESIQWHNITDEMVADKPTAGEVLPDFLNFVDDSIIVGHHVTFDIKMINKEMMDSFSCQINNNWLDTMLIYSHAIIKKDERYSLDYLLDLYNVTCNGRHTALGDALATAEVFTKMIMQASREFKTVRELCDCQKSFIG